ncbi:MAG TPA: ABC transporter permease [Gemmataceae bacterium]|nr:ABC transporter permease [Gemmataceae bacterium]
MSKAITKKPDDRDRRATAFADASAPSLRVQAEPTFARFCALVGATLATIGCVILWLTVIGGRPLSMGPGWGSFLLFVGVSSMLLHAVVDRDLQFRLVYTALAVAVFALGVALCVIPYPAKFGDMFGGGVIALAVALLFALAVLRHETDPLRRDYVLLTLLGAGAVMAGTGLIGGSVSAGFLTPYGLVLSLVGLVYLLAFIGARGNSDDLARFLGWGVLAAGGLTFVVALGRSALPPLFHHFKWIHDEPANYFFPTGLLLMAVGLTYAASAYLACSDAILAILTRRELAAFFYSPMAYLLLFGFTAIAWMSFYTFFSILWDAQHRDRPQPLPEPIVQFYLFNLLPAIAMVFVVPVLTMRLVSEEKRSGTMEMLLTAPVEEPTVVLSKFIAGWLMFLATWVPFYLFLIPLAAAGAPFDYRPLLSFTLGLMVAGAGMVSMGLFFSTLSRNQLVSAVLTFAGMLFLTSIYILGRMNPDPNSAWAIVMQHMSFLQSWGQTLQGKVTPNIGLVFFASMAVFFLFCSVKVLEARKWW